MLLTAAARCVVNSTMTMTEILTFVAINAYSRAVNLPSQAQNRMVWRFRLNVTVFKHTSIYVV